MKKLSVFALLVVCGTSLAVAASLAVPWFVDNAAAKNNLPGVNSGETGIVFLKSNRTDTVVCTIAYYSAEGWFLGPDGLEGRKNTFSINPLSALAFRPTIEDPDGTVCGTSGNWRPCVPADGTPNIGGLEGLQGVNVPDRPRSVDTATPIPGSDDGQGNEVIDRKKNGSIVISWQGGDKDVQGQVSYYATVKEANGSRITLSTAHLLPPGIS